MSLADNILRGHYIGMAIVLVVICSVFIYLVGTQDKVILSQAAVTGVVLDFKKIEHEFKNGQIAYTKFVVIELPDGYTERIYMTHQTEPRAGDKIPINVCHFDNGDRSIVIDYAKWITGN